MKRTTPEIDLYRTLTSCFGGVHRLDFAAVFLVHDLSLHLHGGRQLAGLDRELARDDREALDGLNPRQLVVDGLDLLLEMLLEDVALRRIVHRACAAARELRL